jgi:hypothetical protein
LDHNRLQITFRAPEELKAWLDAQAQTRLLNRSTVITDILVQAMQRSEGLR